MKKLILIIILFCLGLLSHTSCSAKPYSLNESVDKIESIEIVSAANSLEFTVIKTLSEAELEDFLKNFKKLIFINIWVTRQNFVVKNYISKWCL